MSTDSAESATEAAPSPAGLPWPEREQYFYREIKERQHREREQQQVEREQQVAVQTEHGRQLVQGAKSSRELAAGIFAVHVDTHVRREQEREQRRQVPDSDSTAAALERARTNAEAAIGRRGRAQADYDAVLQRALRARAVVDDQCEKIVKLKAWRDSLLDGEAQRILGGLAPEGDPVLVERYLVDAERHLGVFEKAQLEAVEKETEAHDVLEAATRDAADAERRLARAVSVRDAAAATLEYIERLQPIADVNAIVGPWLVDRDFTKGV